jgi:hypothetical protein
MNEWAKLDRMRDGRSLSPIVERRLVRTVYAV